jgi:hypothetical protein
VVFDEQDLFQRVPSRSPDRCAANFLSPSWPGGTAQFSLPLALCSHLIYIYASERREKYEAEQCVPRTFAEQERPGRRRASAPPGLLEVVLLGLFSALLLAFLPPLLALLLALLLAFLPLLLAFLPPLLALLLAFVLTILPMFVLAILLMFPAASPTALPRPVRVASVSPSHASLLYSRSLYTIA